MTFFLLTIFVIQLLYSATDFHKLNWAQQPLLFFHLRIFWIVSKLQVYPVNLPKNIVGLFSVVKTTPGDSVSLSYRDNTKLRAIKRIAYDSFLFSSQLSSYSAGRHPATALMWKVALEHCRAAQKGELKSGPRRPINALTAQGFLMMSAVTDICDILYLKAVLTKDEQFLEEKQ